MRKTNVTTDNAPITVDITKLQEKLSLGRQSCEKLAEKAGAIVQIGKRKVYNLKKIEAYIDKISEGESQEPQEQ